MPTEILLGLIAGSTIFLGLPIALLPKISDKTRGFLNAMSTGILIFILVEIMGKVIEWVEELFESAASGFPTLTPALSFSAILLAGLAAGLLGMVYFEKTFIKEGKDRTPSARQASQLALMIAIGIGIHNLTEGLAIAQAYSWGNESLALFLALGFGLHNATQGFFIAAPLSGSRPSWKFLLLTGAIGGVPTVAGVILGGFWQSDYFRIFSFGLAAGTILFIVGELLHLGRHLKGEAIVEVGLLVGFTLAFAGEMLLVMAG